MDIILFSICHGNEGAMSNSDAGRYAITTELLDAVFIMLSVLIPKLNSVA
jgi:hypothetical protein